MLMPKSRPSRKGRPGFSLELENRARGGSPSGDLPQRHLVRAEAMPARLSWIDRGNPGFRQESLERDKPPLSVVGEFEEAPGDVIRSVKLDPGKYT